MRFYEWWRNLGGSVPPGRGYRATRRAEQVIRSAGTAASKQTANITNLAVGLLNLTEGGAVAVLKHLQINPAELLDAIQRQPNKTPMDQLLTIADKERRTLGHLHLGTEHLLLAFVVHRKNAIAHHLAEQHLDANKFRHALVRQLDPNFSPATG